VGAEREAVVSKTILVLRLVIVGGLVLIPAVGFAVFHGPQITSIYVAHKAVREVPSLALVPRPIAIEDVPRDDRVTLSYFGFEFEAPGNEVEEVKQGSTYARVQFKTGQFVMIWDPKQSLDRVGTINDAAAKKGSRGSDVFGQDILVSNYALVWAELNMTPDKISISMPAKEAIRDLILLKFKGTEIHGAETGLFTFQVGEMRGFQMGDPARAPIVLITAFDSGDREYRLFVGVTKVKAAVVTQRDINAILSSIRPIEGPKEAEK
jgi:hypothetical protein